LEPELQPQNEAAAEASADPGPQKSTAREYLESLVVTVILALFGTTFLVQAFKIPSSSMENTLLIGDHLMVDKVSYAPGGKWSWMLPYKPIQRDQIIVFRYPLDPETYFVKRVIGLPGDRIHLRDKQVFRNGEPLTEPYVVHKTGGVENFRDNFPDYTNGYGFPDWMQQVSQYLRDGDIVVPDGHYFVMGDNRDLSSDSRYWGFVPRENIVGKPLMLYWSYESSSEDYRDTGVSNAAGQWFDVLIHFAQKTRWNRMFRILR
jgi:signal peptidase I